MACTLIGDAVNVAAQLTQLAKGGEILISADIALQVPALMRELHAAEMPPVSLKDKDRPVPYFRPTAQHRQQDVPCAFAARRVSAKAVQ